MTPYRPPQPAPTRKGAGGYALGAFLLALAFMACAVAAVLLR